MENIQQTMQMMEAIGREIEKECRKLFDFAETFKSTLQYEKRLLPYNINVIDELHINENGHSRILTQLLKFQNTKGEYEFYESLIQYIQKKLRSSEFDRIAIDKPHITQEEARIDLWVRDTGYAVIFENKIYNAADQTEQLSRYIDKTKEQYEENNIFVVYLSQSGGEPEAQSWGRYEDSFKKRYANISFRNDILPWLKNDILPNIRQRDFILHSAILQYIDYLEGIFYLRTIENQMNMNLDEFIIKQLALEGKSDKECIAILETKIKDFNEVASKMQTLAESYKKSYEESIANNWKARTKSNFSDLEPNAKNYGYTDVTFHIGGKEVVVFIGDEDDCRLYCQVEFYPFDKNAAVEGTPVMELSDLLPDKLAHCIWKYIGTWDKDYDDVYDLFVKVVEKGRTIFG